MFDRRFYATGTVTDTWSGSIGGLAGENLESGTITNCHAEVTVTSNSSFVPAWWGIIMEPSPNRTLWVM